jgi:hypothetical protein
MYAYVVDVKNVIKVCFIVCFVLLGTLSWEWKSSTGVGVELEWESTHC